MYGMYIWYAVMNSRIFWGETSRYTEPMKAPPVGAKQKKLKFFSRYSKNALLEYVSSKISFFRLRNTFLCVFFFNPYIQINHLYDHKLVRAAKQFELKRYNKQCRRNHLKQCRIFSSRRKGWIMLPEKSRRKSSIKNDWKFEWMKTLP